MSSIGLPTRVTEHTHGSLSQKIYGEGPAPGKKPETESPDGSPELEPIPEIELVRSWSPNDRELPEPDEPRRHTVRLVSPGTRRNVRSVSVRSRIHEPFNQSQTASGRFRSRSPVRTFYEPPICVPTGVPTGVTRTGWSLPLSGDNSRTNSSTLNQEFVFAGATGTMQGPVAQSATTTAFGRQRIGALSLASKKFDGPLFSGGAQAMAGHHFIEGEAYPRRTPAAAAGSVRQRINKNNLFLSFSCSR